MLMYINCAASFLLSEPCLLSFSENVLCREECIPSIPAEKFSEEEEAYSLAYRSLCTNRWC
jgi:hypothetical protein